jgi:hypothetical protein
MRQRAICRVRSITQTSFRGRRGLRTGDVTSETLAASAAGGRMSPADARNSTEQGAIGAAQEKSPLLRYVLAAFACLGIVASLLSNIGVCISEGKVLSDQDYFKGAINSVIHDPVDGVIEDFPGASISKLVHSQRYSSPEEFLHENPNCCKFVPANSGDGGPGISILDRLRGVSTVQVSYAKRYTDESGAAKSTGVMAKVAVRSCGNGRPLR